MQTELLKLQKKWFESLFNDEARSKSLGFVCFFVYYESIKRDLNKKLIFDSRCDVRLKGKVEGCTRLSYTMWREEP